MSKLWGSDTKVMLLQETRIPLDQLDEIQEYFTSINKTLFIHRIRNNLTAIVVDSSIHGRMLPHREVFGPYLTTIQVDNYIIHSYYGERHEAQRRIHLLLLSQEPVDPDLIYILGGDFNMVMSDMLDSSDDRARDGASVTALQQIIDNFNFVDTFRWLHPHKQATTNHNASHKLHRRIDRIYISKSSKNQVRDATIGTAINGSTHKWISCELTNIHIGRRRFIMHQRLIQKQYTKYFTPTFSIANAIHYWDIYILAVEHASIALSGTLRKCNEYLGEPKDAVTKAQLLKQRMQDHGPSKIFSSLEHTKASQTIEANTTSSMLDLASDFYKDLYRSTGRSGMLLTKTVSDSTRQALIQPFTMDELEKAIRSAPTKSTPGPDGIPHEFYKQYESSRQPLLNVANAILGGAPLPRSMKVVYMQLLPKTPTAVNIKDYRPISLIDTSTRLICRMIATRLIPALDELIGPHQTGFLAKRRVDDNITQVLNALEYMDGSVYTGFAVVDFEKAFDKLNHDYLERVLYASGFDPSFVKLLMKFTANHTGYIYINNERGPPIPLDAGVRQGNPISPLLFNIALEPLLARLASNLDGIRSSNRMFQFKVGAYADDLVVGLNHIADHHVLHDELEAFCHISGSKVSASKSVFFGNSDEVSPLNYTFKPITEGFKYLGVHTRSHSWAKILATIQHFKRHHQLDDFPLALMVRAIKTYYVSKLYHYDIHQPMKAEDIKAFNNILGVFKGERFERLRQILPPLHGGLGMIDLQEQLYGRRAKQVWLACQSDAEHSRYFKYKLQEAVNKTFDHTWNPSGPTELYPWWEFIIPGRYRCGSRVVSTLMVITTMMDMVSIENKPYQREVAWITAWFKLHPRPSRNPDRISMKSLTLEEVLSYTFEPTTTLQYEEKSIVESHFHQRSKKMIESLVKTKRHLNKKLMTSTSFRDFVTPDQVQSFWKTFHNTQKYYPHPLDYIKMFNLGYLNFHEADLINKRTGRPALRPNLNTGWGPDSWCYLCSEHNNSPKHIYSECRISLQIWQRLIAGPRPQWHEMYLSENKLNFKFNLYLKTTVDAFEYQVRMQVNGKPCANNWIDEYLFQFANRLCRFLPPARAMRGLMRT
ncbi:hypothetical protein CLIB1444_30S00122 [[Candida] jaroonii]|uniref:Uncharacterized protein n=1 Tax=[Candida] jaroonii TaxID=467808 RepID=A0ACA9YFX3_9ASCO|nr:hypothetical protein CLIB1444_30S00122 [[Candida] jaroonii]